MVNCTVCSGIHKVFGFWKPESSEHFSLMFPLYSDFLTCCFSNNVCVSTGIKRPQRLWAQRARRRLQPSATWARPSAESLGTWGTIYHCLFSAFFPSLFLHLLCSFAPSFSVLCNCQERQLSPINSTMRTLSTVLPCWGRASCSVIPESALLQTVCLRLCYIKQLSPSWH